MELGDRFFMREISERVDWNVLNQFGHMEHMSEEQLTERVYKSNVEGRREIGRPYASWFDGVKKCCSARSLVVVV